MHTLWLPGTSQIWIPRVSATYWVLAGSNPQRASKLGLKPLAIREGVEDVARVGRRKTAKFLVRSADTPGC